jgi:hypothetical protein
MNKINLKIIVITLVGLLLLYILFSLGALSFSLKNWHKDLRVLWVIVDVVWIAISFGLNEYLQDLIFKDE